jgi:hypothetical protein
MTTARYRSFRLLPVLALAACTAWQPLAHPLNRAASARLPYGLRITLADGTRRTLIAPFIRADSLLGLRGRDTIAVSLQEIRQAERERFSIGNTAAMLLGVSAALLVALVIYCGGDRCVAVYTS